jgi:hypothetical protein
VFLNIVHKSCIDVAVMPIFPIYGAFNRIIESDVSKPLKMAPYPI